MTKVLHLISSSGFFGADNMLIELSKGLRHTTFSPIIGVFKNLHNPHLEVVKEAKRHNFPVEIFPCKGRLDLRAILSIRRFLEGQKFDIIHTHGYKSNLYALAASFGKKVPRVTTCHNWLGDAPKMRFYARLDKFFLNRFDRLIAVSDSLRQEILKQNISPQKVLTIYNGVGIDRFNTQKKPDNIRTEFGIDEGCKIIGTVGRLSEEKGHIHLLHAAKKVIREYPKTVFLIVGGGPLRQRLEAKSSLLATPFIFTGVRNDMPVIYSIMDIFVLPSLTEGLPMALLEAMASQRPVVATKVGAVPRVIKHGSSGLLIKPADVEGLAKAIMDLLANPQKGHYLAKNAYEIVRQHFSSQGMAEKYVEVYKEVLGLTRQTQQTQSTQ
jgi:glycosyltransferase involved in cell wall biosynthesis